MKRCDAAVISTWVAHALAWVVALWLAVGPVYQGVSVTPVTPGDVARESTRVTASLIEVNGWRVLPLLLAPVVLTSIPLSAVLLTDAGQARRLETSANHFANELLSTGQDRPALQL